MIEMRRVLFRGDQEILQYRYVTDGLYGGGGETGVYACAPHCWRWSKWQNVPPVDYRALHEDEIADATGLRRAFDIHGSVK